MAEPLQILLEKEFRLCYYVSGFTLECIRNMDLIERDWFYSRLVKQLNDERDEISKSNSLGSNG